MEPKLLTAERFVDTHNGCSYRYVHSDTEYFRPHYHDYYEVFLLLKGEATHCINGQRIPLQRGALVFIRPNDVHDYLPVEGEQFSMLNITFTQETCHALFAYLGEGFAAARLLHAALPPMILLPAHRLNYILSQMAVIRTIGEGEKDRLKTAIRILLFRIFTHFFADFAEENESDVPLWLRELCDRMKRNGNFAYGIPRLLSLTDKSREHVSRCMKKYMGQTLSEFVNGLRLNFVANMLQNSNHSIADIVFESGFGNLSWAAELFRERYGCTMSQYRKICAGT